MLKRPVRTLSFAGQKQQFTGNFEQINEQLFYMIECRHNCFFLRSQPKSWRISDPLRITGNQKQQDYIKQLWMFKRLSNSEYQIIHVKTGLVLTIQDFQALLVVDEMLPTQKFEIIPWRNNFIRIKDYTGAILRLDGVLQSADYNERDQSQLFKLKSIGIFEVPQLKDTVFIMTDDKAHSLDLSNSSREAERDIIVYKRNMRMNQRWKFNVLYDGKGKDSFHVQILSALTDMFVVHNRDGGGIMQASYPEQWVIEQTEIKQYIYIRHAKLAEYLSCSPTNEIYFATTKKSKWYILNRTEGLQNKRRGILRTITI